MGYTPHVLVVGGGVTGTSVARDLAMRGLDVTLVEKGPLTDGTTGRMQGLLHSGARYAIDDPEGASRCLAENRTLRRIASHCIEETGGLFLSLPGDDPEYFDRKREACAACDIPVEELDGESLREREPAIAPEVERGFTVPDAAVDPFRLTVATAQSAIEYGAEIRTHTRVTTLEREDGAVTGARVIQHSPATDGATAERTETIDADFVVNATGPWADRIAGSVDLDVPIARSRGAMVVAHDPELTTTLNRCRPRADGDILVPHGEMSILGTTHEPVEDPESHPREQWEVDALVDELADLAPHLADAHVFRSYWGVRPLFDPAPDESSEPNDLSRGFSVLDHERREDTWGIVSVVGGKFTTARAMAEAVTDLVCAKFGIRRACRTAEFPLPGSDDIADLEAAMERFDLSSPVAQRVGARQGGRTSSVLSAAVMNPVVCECESVTRGEIQDAFQDQTAERTDLNEVRIRTRAAMGTCQGGRCIHRIAGELYPQEHEGAVSRAMSTLHEERWKGQRETLWGDSLAQAMRNYALHATTMNRDDDLQDRGSSVDFRQFDDGPDEIWEDED